MPIITVQYVDIGNRAELEDGVCQQLADALGAVLQSEPGGTWVKLNRIDESEYAENDTTLDSSVQPTLVEVLKRTPGDEESLASEAEVIADVVSSVMQRPRQNVHVIYLPQGAGRVAFGGKLVRREGD